MACLAGGVVAFTAEMKLYEAIDPSDSTTSQKYLISASFFAAASCFLLLMICFLVRYVIRK